LAESWTIVDIEEYSAWSRDIDWTTKIGKAPRDITCADTKIEGASAVVEREFLNVDKRFVDSTNVELDRP
jgi:hypothetical protein